MVSGVIAHEIKCQANFLESFDADFELRLYDMPFTHFDKSMSVRLAFDENAAPTVSVRVWN